MGFIEYNCHMEIIDEYLSKYAAMYAHDDHLLIPIYQIIDVLLEVRNAIQNEAPEMVIDGDEMTKYFAKK